MVAPKGKGNDPKIKLDDNIRGFHKWIDELGKGKIDAVRIKKAAKFALIPLEKEDTPESLIDLLLEADKTLKAAEKARDAVADKILAMYLKTGQIVFTTTPGGCLSSCVPAAAFNPGV